MCMIFTELKNPCISRPYFLRRKARIFRNPVIMVLTWNCSYIHCPAKTWIYLTSYVCTKRIFDSRPFMNNKIFLKKLLQKFVVHIFTLYLARSVNFSRHSESVKYVWKSKNRCYRIEGKCRRYRNSSKCLKTHFATNNWPIWTKKKSKDV